MNKLIRRLLGIAAIGGAALAPHAQAANVTINFEGAGLTGLYFPGDSFLQSGFRMTTDFDFGTVDTGAALDPSVRPSGNNTQYYFNSNDGGIIVERADGGLFNLTGFSAALVPLNTSQQTVIVAFATNAAGVQFGTAFPFGAAVNNIFPFATYGNPLDFASFSKIRQVEFFACSLVGNQVCTVNTNNNGQFAIDDILLSTVPEPASFALVTVALFGLRLSTRRNPAGIATRSL